MSSNSTCNDIMESFIYRYSVHVIMTCQPPIQSSKFVRPKFNHARRSRCLRRPPPLPGPIYRRRLVGR